MPYVDPKTESNVFYQARIKASAHNESLSSRESAGSEMSIDRGRMYRIESGSANPYPEEVHMMAGLYNAPELRNYYCREICPLGCDVPPVKDCSLDRITVKAMATLNRIDGTMEELLSIAEDGRIQEEEKPLLAEVVKKLDEVNEIRENLKVWIQKNVR